MTVFEMEIFYTLFPYSGLYVQEMSIFFVLPLPVLFFVDWFRPPAVYRRTSLPSNSQHSPCQGVQMATVLLWGDVANVLLNV